jgi:hypothetical protein
MDLEELAAAVHHAVETHPPRPDGGYPAEVKEAGLTYARASRAAGESWRIAASRVPISTTTLGKWVRRAATPSSGAALQLVPVEVSDPGLPLGSSHPVLVSPSGFRLEGLCVGDAVAALQALA